MTRTTRVLWCAALLAAAPVTVLWVALRAGIATAHILAGAVADAWAGRG